MPGDPADIQRALFEKGILGPIPSSSLFPNLEAFAKSGFFSVTEKTSDGNIRFLADSLGAIQ